MSLLTGPRRFRSRETRASSPTNSLGELLRRREPPFSLGVHVDADTAARHSAVFACIDLIARLVSTLPVHEFLTDDQGTRRRLPRPAVLLSPDGELDLSGWLYQVIDSLLKRGNAYALIQRYDSRGFPAQMATVHPDQVSFTKNGRNGPVNWFLDGKPIDKYPAGDLWHLPAYLVAGSPVGLAPISYAALTISTGIAAQQFGAMWFRDGMVPAALLVNDEEVPPSLADLVKDMWRNALSGNREPIVLGDGWQYQQVSVKPEESQFLDTIHANVADVARFFGVEPEAIGATRQGGSSVLYQNVEQAQIHLLVRTIQPWIVRLERALSAIRPRPRQVKFNVDALLRVDLMTRVKAHDVGVRGGWVSPDEVRELEDKPPIPDGAGERWLWPPGRMQLDRYELEFGADSDPEDEAFEQQLVNVDVDAVGVNGDVPGSA